MILVVVKLSLLIASAHATVLDDYVWKADANYKYEVVANWTIKQGEVTSYLLNLTSQRWLTDDIVTRSVWYHDLIVNIPNNLDLTMRNKAFLLIEGGDKTDGLPTTQTRFLEELITIAAETRSVTAMVRQVPNQSIMFKDDPEEKDRKEDAIIAYGWRKFLDDTSKAEWMALLPMTKAAVKAMDAVTDFVKNRTHNEIDSYCVGGASKRGWTSLLVAAVDEVRVKCVAPSVFTAVRIRTAFQNQYKSFGGWSFLLSDYTASNITKYWTTNYAPMRMGRKIIDPYKYRKRLKAPKFFVVAANDEIFPADDTRTFFFGLKDAKYVNVIPNVNHGFANKKAEVFRSIGWFYLSVMKGTSLPRVSWQMQSSAGFEGSMRVTTDRKPSSVVAWYATTVQNKSRDFRGSILDAASGTPVAQNITWFSDNVVSHGQYFLTHTYSYSMDNPPTGGWNAFFIQMKFPMFGGFDFECTTEVKVVPDIFPFGNCVGDGCIGPLV